MNIFHVIGSRLLSGIEFVADKIRSERIAEEDAWRAVVDERIARAFMTAEKNHGLTLDRNSIVDLMKALGFRDDQTDLATRQALAERWRYKGDPNDTATLNQWLMEQTKKRLYRFGEAPDMA